MDKPQIIQFANLIGTKVEGISSQGWAQCRCPLAKWTHDSGKDSNASAALEIKPGGASRFHCFTCEDHDLLSLLNRLKEFGATLPKVNIKDALVLVVAEEDDDIALQIKDYDQPLHAEEDDGNNDTVFEEEWLLSFQEARKIPRAVEYLTKRGLDAYTIHDLDLRWDSGRETVCFPIRDMMGRLCGLRGRRIAPTGDQPPYHMYKTKPGQDGRYNRNVWLGENTIEWEKPVVMVESVFDFAAVYPYYPNVAAPLTVGMGARKVKRMASALDIVTLFDLGKGGDKARKLIDKYLPQNTRVHLLPCGPDRLNPAEPATDPGEMTPAALLELLAPHVPL